MEFTSFLKDSNTSKSFIFLLETIIMLSLKTEPKNLKLYEQDLLIQIAD